jgi:hypothetical protein
VVSNAAWRRAGASLQSWLVSKVADSIQCGASRYCWMNGRWIVEAEFACILLHQSSSACFNAAVEHIDNV